MLLTRRHGMGSSKPSDQEMPFGYTFSEADTRIPSPVDPPPGPELLDDNENKYMQDFFSGFGNDAPYDFNASNFMDNLWELPPSFLGTSSSFGQPPQNTPQPQPIATPNRQTMNGLDLDLRTQDGGFSNMNGNMGMHHGMPSTSPDVYRAASTLIQSNHNGRHTMGSEAMYGIHQGDNMLAANGHNLHQSMYPARPRSMHDARPSQDAYMPDNYYVNPFGGEINSVAIPGGTDALRSKGKEVEIRWGSDMGFGNEQGFVPPPGQETAEEVEKEHIRRVMSFAPVPDTVSSNEITLPTRPSSPRRKSIANIKAEDDDLRLRKRRKSKFVDEEDEDEDGDDEVPSSAAGRVSAKKRKSTSKPLKSPTSPANEVTSKRKKSSAAAAAAAAKATRENLTEDQKRENHIRSEQKRRTLIREGFADLGELVPGLQGGGFSKSAVLTMAADFLAQLLEGNEDLRTRVAELGSSG